MAKGNTIAMRKEEDDWQTQRDLETLMEAERIEKDAKRLAKAQALAKKRLMSLAAVAAEGSDDS